MQQLLVTVSLGHKSGLVEDSVVNNFAVQMPDGWAPSLDALDLSGPIASFYNAVQASGKSIASFMGFGLSRVAGAAKIKAYDIAPALDGSPHGSPIMEDQTTLNAGDNSDSLPEECALAMTFRSGGWEDQPLERPDSADAGTEIDRPQSRYSGRVFLGPWHTGCVGLDGASKTRPAPLLITTMLDAGVKLSGDLQAVGGRLCVWSRKDAILRPVDGPGYDPGAIQVDNAFDTQRRRGPAPTVRSSRVV